MIKQIEKVLCFNKDISKFFIIGNIKNNCRLNPVAKDLLESVAIKYRILYDIIDMKELNLSINHEITSNSQTFQEFFKFLLN